VNQSSKIRHPEGAGGFNPRKESQSKWAFRPGHPRGAPGPAFGTWESRISSFRTLGSDEPILKNPSSGGSWGFNPRTKPAKSKRALAPRTHRHDSTDRARDSRRNHSAAPHLKQMRPVFAENIGIPIISSASISAFRRKTLLVSVRSCVSILLNEVSRPASPQFKRTSSAPGPTNPPQRSPKRNRGRKPNSESEYRFLQRCRELPLTRAQSE
jgi:hypothetical protein